MIQILWYLQPTTWNKFHLSHHLCLIWLLKEIQRDVVCSLIRFISFPSWTWLKKKDSELCYFPIGCANTSCVRGPLKMGLSLSCGIFSSSLMAYSPSFLSLSLPFSLFFPCLCLQTNYRSIGRKLVFMNKWLALTTNYSNLG